MFSCVYGVSPRGCCGFVVTAVTAMTLMTVIYGLILIGALLYFVGPYPST